MSRAEPKVVIVGAGPAGMMLAYQLASNGVAVDVVERHADFRREFRGELMMPSVLGPLNELRLLPALLASGNARSPVERRLFVGRTRRVTAPGGPQVGAWVSQAGLLELLHRSCTKYPNYRMRFDTTAMSLIRSELGVTGVEVRHAGSREIVDADLVVISNGRGSGLRESAGLNAVRSLTGADVLWLRFNLEGAPHLLPESVNVHMHGRGKVLVLFRADGEHLHAALSAPGNLAELRQDSSALHGALSPLLPEPLKDLLLAQLATGITSQLLRVAIDRLESWYVPGALFIGDAAHTMSPMAGQGLNVAIRDAIVAANHILDAIRSGDPVSERVLAAIQAEREPEIDAMQAVQARVHRIVAAPMIIEHVMFSILGIVLGLKRSAQVSQGALPVVMKYAVPISETIHS